MPLKLIILVIKVKIVTYLFKWLSGMTIAESDTWEGRENLKNAKKAIKEFKREYQQDIEDVVQQEHKEEIFKREELPGCHKLHLAISPSIL